MGTPFVPQTFLTDTFTDTDGTLIAAHTPDLGGAWSLYSGSGATIQTNRVYCSVTACIIQNAATPPSANYAIEVVVDFVAANSDNIGIAGRITAGNNYYLFRFAKSVNQWQLAKIANNVTTNLDTTVSDTWTSGSHTVRLEMSGSNLRAYIDGSLVSSGSDSQFSTAGLAGYRWSTTAQTTTTGRHLTSLTAYTIP